MTDAQLRKIRDANRSDGLLVHFINELIRPRRNYARAADPDCRGTIQYGIACYENALLDRGIAA